MTRDSRRDHIFHILLHSGEPILLTRDAVKFVRAEGLDLTEKCIVSYLKELRDREMLTTFTEKVWLFSGKAEKMRRQSAEMVMALSG